MVASKCVALIVFVALLAVNKWPSMGASDDSAAWSQYKRDFNKSYANPEEENFRRELFQAELRRIESHNSDSSTSYKLGLNHMSDWTKAEFKGLLSVGAWEASGLQARIFGPDPYVAEILNQSSGPAPAEFDWRQGWPRRVGSVKHQGNCGASWAFATTALLESQQMGRLNMTRVTPLSEQQLLDCGRVKSCQLAGHVGWALEEVSKWGGIMSEQDYPYKDVVQMKCFINEKQFAVKKVKGVAGLRLWNEEEMKTVLHRYGPIAASFSACSWHNYHSGVLPASMCDGRVDHWALIVGYGRDCRSGLDYWIVQNSWGSGFGEGGYIRIERNKNACHIADTPLIAKVKP